METGYLNRLHLVTAPVTVQTCAGAILLDLQVRTRTREDLLVVRLRDPGLPHRVWTHAEVKLRGFDGDGGRLRLLLEPPPLILPAGDRIWLDVASHDNARIRIGGEAASRIVLVKAPLQASEAAYESKGLMPVVAEATKAHYRPWTFERIPPDLDNPHTLGGHFDSVMPALAVSRVLPRSVIAQDYLDMAGVLPQARDAYGLAVPPDASFSPDRVPEGVPSWAWLQQRAKAFRLRVIDWMVRNQNSDGQLGEGWNDDVFLLVGRYDVPLDGHLGARRMYLRLFEGLDRTNMLGGGRVRISPMDQFHTEDLYSTRFHSVLFELGDPHIVRRALQTAWHLGKPDRTPRYYFGGEPFLYDYNVLRWYWGTGPRHAYQGPSEEQVMGGLTFYYKENDDLRFRRYTEAWNARRGGEQMITGMVLGGWGHSTRNPNSDDLSMHPLLARGRRPGPGPVGDLGRQHRPRMPPVLLRPPAPQGDGAALPDRPRGLRDHPPRVGGGRRRTTALDPPPEAAALRHDHPGGAARSRGDPRRAPGPARPRRPPAAGPGRGRLRLRAERLHPEGAGLQRRREAVSGGAAGGAVGGG